MDWVYSALEEKQKTQLTIKVNCKFKLHLRNGVQRMIVWVLSMGLERMMERMMGHELEHRLVDERKMEPGMMVDGQCNPPLGVVSIWVHWMDVLGLGLSIHSRQGRK